MKVGLVITAYNRLGDLKKTINSLACSILPKDLEIFIIDDCSTDDKVWPFIESITINNIHIEKIKNKTNKGMFYGLAKGFEYFFTKGFDVFVNLDSDTIVKPHWLGTLLNLHKHFPLHIVSGFNTSAHPILESFSKYHTKKSVGGINLLFGREFYPIVLPTLTSNKWDWNLCDKMALLGKPFIVAKPSVVQHISTVTVAHAMTRNIDKAGDWVHKGMLESALALPKSSYTSIKKEFKKVKKIMFVQATRGRPVKGVEAALRITSTMRSNVPFTYYFSVDTDDLTLKEYEKNIEGLDFVNGLIVANNKGCVDATNQGATKHSDEDLIIVSGDDMAVRTIGWDVYVLDFIEKNINKDEYLVHFPNETANSKEVAIYQFLSGSLYRKLGWIFYPGYISMYGDNDLWATCTQLGVRYDYLTPPNPLLFYHDHPGLGGSMEWDDTYHKTNSSQNYQVGEQLYAQRKTQKFPIR